MTAGHRPAVSIPAGSAAPGRLPDMPTYTYGGQALIEGVLMRGRDAIAVALRHPDGGIVFATERLDAGFHGIAIDVRLPYLDLRLIHYALALPAMPWLQGKRLLPPR